VEVAVRSKFEIALEWGLFASRWLLAPLYLGMILVLGAILVVFFRELAAEVANLWHMDGEQIILLALSLVDLSLTANLLLIVIFAGYENFVSKIHIGAQEDRPAWMGTVDFSGWKIKLIASIVAISAICCAPSCRWRRRMQPSMGLSCAGWSPFTSPSFSRACCWPPRTGYRPA
jgi:uncharacterized protein (TIGR00645 family)